MVVPSVSLRVQKRIDRGFGVGAHTPMTADVCHALLRARFLDHSGSSRKQRILTRSLAQPGEERQAVLESVLPSFIFGHEKVLSGSSQIDDFRRPFGIV